MTELQQCAFFLVCRGKNQSSSHLGSRCYTKFRQSSTGGVVINAMFATTPPSQSRIQNTVTPAIADRSDGFPHSAAPPQRKTKCRLSQCIFHFFDIFSFFLIFLIFPIFHIFSILSIFQFFHFILFFIYSFFHCFHFSFLSFFSFFHFFHFFNVFHFFIFFISFIFHFFLFSFFIFFHFFIFFMFFSAFFHFPPLPPPHPGATRSLPLPPGPSLKHSFFLNNFAGATQKFRQSSTGSVVIKRRHCLKSTKNKTKWRNITCWTRACLEVVEIQLTLHACYFTPWFRWIGRRSGETGKAKASLTHGKFEVLGRAKPSNGSLTRFVR